MSARLAALRLPGLAFLVSALAAAGCGTGGGADIPVATTTATPRTATVVSGDIVSVVIVDGSVVATPAFLVSAPIAGVFHAASPADAAGGAVGSITARDGTTTAVALPVDTRLLGVTAHDGDRIPAGLPLARAQALGFAIQATIPAEKLYRFYGTLGASRGQVAHGPGPFDCPLLGPPQVVGAAEAPTASAGSDSAPSGADSAGTAQGPVALTCAIPGEYRLFAGMPAVMAVTAAERHGVLVLPIAAVAGTTQDGEVTMDQGGGKTETRHVKVGITDGAVIEITSGLAAGDVVRVPGPDLAPGVSDGGQ
jgi:membrane fusion protein, macrolide-specific efflux system